MPELGALKPYNLPALTFQPLNPASFFDRTVPEITPDTKKLADATATAAMMGAISDTFSKIPQQVEQGFTNYRKNELWGDYNDLSAKAATGDKAAQGALSGFTVTPDDITHKPIDSELRQAQLESYKTRGVEKQPIYDGVLSQFPAPGQPSVTAIATPSAGESNPSDRVEWIKGMEGFKSKAYSDSGQTSIGYGTRGKPGEVLDETTADARLRAELADHEARVDSLAAASGVRLTPAQRDALISFDFNTGSANRIFEVAARNGVLDPAAATAKMAEYRHADATKKDGALEGRRAKEIARFQSSANAEPSISAVPGATPAVADIVRRPTMGFNRQMNAAIIAPDPTSVKAIMPGDRVVDITPRVSEPDEDEMKKVDNALAKEGYDPKGMTREQKFAQLRELSGGKRLTEGEQKTATYVTRAEAANSNLDAILKTFDPTTLGNAAKVAATGNAITNYFSGEDAQKFDQAVREFSTAILRKDTGASISANERADVHKTYIPQAGDTPATLAQKAEARARAIAALKAGVPHVEIGGKKDDAAPAPKTPEGMVAMLTPDGKPMFIPKQNVQAAIARGAKLAQ